MVTRNDSGGSRQPSANTGLYRSAFLRRCHQLLAIGYARMDAAFFQGAEEPVITGALVLMMNNVLESPNAPQWAAHFLVLDDPPVNDPERTGKQRRRVDIELVRTRPGTRPRFRFEAKRLHESDSVAKYVGPEGLECFLDGAYAADDPDAGMLGYVQVDEPQEWADKIEKKLSKDHPKYRVRRGGDFKPKKLVSELNNTYYSQHDRPSVGRPISIYHTFLRFN